MFIVEDNEISVTRGDTAILNIATTGYNFVEGDIVHLTVKKNKNDINPTIAKTVSLFEGNIAKIFFSTTDTTIAIGKYWYDIQINFADGRVETVIAPTRFIVMEEITI